MNANYSEVVKTAQEYYNSDDADNFYFHIWGGEDIHIGLYEDETDTIAAASERTVAKMAGMLTSIQPGSNVIDLGAGYGGAARWLHHKFGCNVTCVNLSEAQNARNRDINEKLGISNRIEVIDGSFEDLSIADSTFDVAWSQDAILHSGQREKVLNEVDRVLKPGGEFIFTDPMQSDTCPDGVLQPVLDRIHLDTLGSFEFYLAIAEKLNWKKLRQVEMTHQLIAHYGRVRQELLSRREELEQFVSPDYITRMIQGLEHWIEAGKNSYLAWGIMHYQKPD